MDELTAPLRGAEAVRSLALTLGPRILKEVGLGVLAVGAAFLVIVPALFLVSLLYGRGGPYAVLTTTVTVGVALLFYQAQIRPRLH